jgi:hypothetical protein
MRLTFSNCSLSGLQHALLEFEINYPPVPSDPSELIEFNSNEGVAALHTSCVSSSEPHA